MKKIKVREAKERDIGLFRKLFKEYLIEHYENGSHVLPDENLPLYEEIFKMYVNGEEKGIVLFVGECAVAMYGSQGKVPIKTDLEPLATGWGVYVMPEHRGKHISFKLLEEAKKKLKELGFKTVLDACTIQNERAFNIMKKNEYENIQHVLIRELKE